MHNKNSVWFFRRQDPDSPTTFQSMCSFCFDLCSRSSDIGHLIEAERIHRCAGIDTARRAGMAKIDASEWQGLREAS